MKKYSVAMCVFGIVLVGFSCSVLAQQESLLYREITGFGGMTFGPYEEATGGVALAFNLSPGSESREKVVPFLRTTRNLMGV